MTANTPRATRPFYWSVRREVWENRSVYIALLCAAGVGLLAFGFSLRRLAETMRGEHAPIDVVMPYAHISGLLVLAVFVVGIFYALEALHSERRERSILFWKSLPVSDATTVLAKASIPLVLMPVVALVIGVAAELLMFVLSLVVALGSGVGVAAVWREIPLFQLQIVLLYELVVVALWHAPIYGWLLLVSGWARRATFLWAFLPPLAVGIFEFIAFHTHHVNWFLGERLFGFASQAFSRWTPSGTLVDPHMILVAELTPGRFLATPGLWVGLVIAAVLIYAAIRMRRYRGPV
jgi:ABC-2 type transport system permease protein